MNLILAGLITIVGAYLIGSFPTGFLLVKIFKGEDIRNVGSGSTGATNVKRIMGKTGFFTVMIIDAIKGFVPVIIAQHFDTVSTIHILPILASFGVIIGHSKSIFLKFTGGKSVATTAGTIIALNWMVAIICFAIWAIIAYVSKYISLASITAMVLMTILMFCFKSPLSYVIYCAIAAIYVIYLHRENIKRLMNGTENKVR